MIAAKCGAARSTRIPATAPASAQNATKPSGIRRILPVTSEQAIQTTGPAITP
jgi:hypothetical protein